uniref:Uncharacterized protein n=1 Tax=Oryza nivara TaxID=4536 RepID=A0A0E0HQK9_ORYNI
MALLSAGAEGFGLAAAALFLAVSFESHASSEKDRKAALLFLPFEWRNPTLARREATAAVDPRASEPGGDGGGGYSCARRRQEATAMAPTRTHEPGGDGGGGYPCTRVGRRRRQRIPVRASREAMAAIDDADDYGDDAAGDDGDRKVCGWREAALAPLSSVPSSILRAASVSSVPL